MGARQSGLTVGDATCAQVGGQSETPRQMSGGRRVGAGVGLRGEGAGVGLRGEGRGRRGEPTGGVRMASRRTVGGLGEREARAGAGDEGEGER